ncbi:iron dicitrate transport regulator FecR [Flavobacterium alvei]|uniref:Iron dicitrate transport regulator FecR n=1 Tax=Flavobacterium alvei TaxID=2080416 RepID=A0A2S5AEQ6_9FLAO|nr:FecR family protein [Flavobacterium alvei]POY40593.1 iron dicitrate transport regulator FecR [Flavobacterium alvei]
MEKNYILTKWLNDELTDAELAEFKADPDFEKYEKIKNYSAQLKVTDFDEAKVLKNILQHKKTTPKVIPLYKNWIFRVAAILVIALGITFTVQNFSSETQLALNGARTTFSLPDHSEVVLNAGSEIEYKKWNWDNNRNLQLKGEAYFKVAKGEKFEVKTTLGKVTVLGTQFNVKARKNRFDITCFEGRVKVNYKDKEIILTPGKSVAFENGKQINLLVDNQKPEWLENKIAFSKENLRNILDEIQRQYNLTIEVQADYPSELFTGKIPLNNLDVALEIIATTYHLEPNKISPNKIIFEGK